MEVWVVVGKELFKNSTKYVYLVSNAGNRRSMTPIQLGSFQKNNKVLNVKSSGGSLQGINMSLQIIPAYKKLNNGLISQVSGISENEMMQLAQQLVNNFMVEYNYKKELEINKQKQERYKKIEYVINKLNILKNIVDNINNMKDITNVNVLMDNISRYIKQLDIDNTGEDIGTSVKRYGVNGLANSLQDRLRRCAERANRDNIMTEIINGISIRDMIDIIDRGIQDIRNKHRQTKEIIQDNRNNTEKVVLEAEESDMIPVNMEGEDTNSSLIESMRRLNKPIELMDNDEFLDALDFDIPIVADDEEGLISLDITTKDIVRADLSKLNDMQRDIEYDVSYIQDNIQQQINKLNKIDMHYYWSKYNTLIEDNLMVGIYKHLIKALELERNRLVEELKDELTNTKGIATETKTITNASSKEIKDALRLYDDI